MSTRVYVGIGSNLDRESRIREAVSALQARFEPIAVSPVYDTEAVGFEGSNFLNLVVGFDTDASIESVIAAFRQIEDELGRDRTAPKFGSRSIDLDILLYGDLARHESGIQVPRAEILQNAFVLKPLQDLAPDELHPETGERFAVLWQRMEPGAPQLALFPMQFERLSD
ncbi:MAG: 2-amino-4-hydroxy-6-hydroxymethyldihydropteridine diphosphokinase [Pseudomonadota bacterium]